MGVPDLEEDFEFKFRTRGHTAHCPGLEVPGRTWTRSVSAIQRYDIGQEDNFSRPTVVVRGIDKGMARLFLARGLR